MELSGTNAKNEHQATQVQSKEIPWTNDLRYLCLLNCETRTWIGRSLKYQQTPKVWKKNVKSKQFTDNFD